MAAEGTDLQCLDGQLEVIHRTRGAREVEHAVQWPLQLDEVGDVVEDELEVAVTFQVGEIGRRARDEIVHADHPVTLREQPVAQVRPEESRGPGYEDPHARWRPMLS